MIRPTATPAASFTSRQNAVPPGHRRWCGVGDTYASSPNSSAIRRMRSEWNGSLTSSTRSSPAPRSRSATPSPATRTTCGRRPPAGSPLGGHAAVDEVVGRRLGLGEPVAGLVAAGDHDQRRQPSLPQLDHVVEPGRQLRRRAAVVLRGTHHHDRVDRAGLVAAARPPHLPQVDSEVPDQQPARAARRAPARSTAGAGAIRTPDRRRDRPPATIGGCRRRRRSPDGAPPAARAGGAAPRRARAAPAASNSGGPTVRPVTATRTGACALPGFSS